MVNCELVRVVQRCDKCTCGGHLSLLVQWLLVPDADWPDDTLAPRVLRAVTHLALVSQTASSGGQVIGRRRVEAALADSGLEHGSGDGFSDAVMRILAHMGVLKLGGAYRSDASTVSIRFEHPSVQQFLVGLHLARLCLQHDDGLATQFADRRWVPSYRPVWVCMAQVLAWPELAYHSQSARRMLRVMQAPPLDLHGYHAVLTHDMVSRFPVMPVEQASRDADRARGTTVRTLGGLATPTVRALQVASRAMRRIFGAQRFVPTREGCTADHSGSATMMAAWRTRFVRLVGAHSGVVLPCLMEVHGLAPTSPPSGSGVARHSSPSGMGARVLPASVERAVIMHATQACHGGADGRKQLERVLEDAELRCRWGPTWLWVAASEGHVGVVSDLISGGVDVNCACTDVHVTPLYVACEDGHAEVVDRLLRVDGLDVNRGCAVGGATPLYIACQNGHVAVMSLLLRMDGLDVNQACANNGATPLYIACWKGHLEVVERLLQADGLDVNQASTNGGATPLYVACQNGHVEVMARLLQADGLDVNQGCADNGATPLYAACQNGNVGAVESLLRVDGLDVNQACTDGATPLYAACWKGELEVVESLLRADALDVNQVSMDGGATPLYVACQNSHVAVVERLLHVEGLDVNQACTSGGATPLYVACQDGNVEVVECLLQQADGLDVNQACTDGGATPLYVACQNGHMGVVVRLLRVDGLDMHTAHVGGSTPIKVARHCGHMRVMWCLQLASLCWTIHVVLRWLVGYLRRAGRLLWVPNNR